MGHALVFLAWPEEVRAGNKFPDFCEVSAARSGLRSGSLALDLRAFEDGKRGSAGLE